MRRLNTVFQALAELPEIKLPRDLAPSARPPGRSLKPILAAQAGAALGAAVWLSVELSTAIAGNCRR